MAFSVLRVVAGSVTLSLSPAAPNVTDMVSVNAILSPGATGSVQFLVDGIASGAAVAVSGLKTTGTLGPLTPGVHTITANNTGDGVYTAATGSLPVGKSSSTPV